MNMGFDALIPALSAGTIDVIASGISITEERQKKVDFTSPYYQSGLSYLVRKADAEKIKTFADLKGKTLAVQIGTTGAAYAKNVEGARVSAFNTTSEAFMDLNVKNADAVVLDPSGARLLPEDEAARCQEPPSSPPRSPTPNTSASP